MVFNLSGFDGDSDAAVHMMTRRIWEIAVTRGGGAQPEIDQPTRPALILTDRFTEVGGDEDLAPAGLLHDAAKDHCGEPRLAENKANFVPRFEFIVRLCSASLPTDPGEIDAVCWTANGRIWSSCEAHRRT